MFTKKKNKNNSQQKCQSCNKQHDMAVNLEMHITFSQTDRYVASYIFFARSQYKQYASVIYK